MKKILSILLLCFAIGINAQTQTFNTQVKLNNVPSAGVGDTLVLVQGADKVIKKVGKSTFGSGSVSTLQSVTTNGNTTSNNVVINNNNLRVVNTTGSNDERIIIEPNAIVFVPSAIEYTGTLSLPSVSGEPIAWDLPDLSGTIGLVEQDFGNYGSYSFGGQYSNQPEWKKLYFQAKGGGIDGFVNDYSLSINAEEGAYIRGQSIGDNTYSSLSVGAQEASLAAASVTNYSYFSLQHDRFLFGTTAGEGSNVYNFLPSDTSPFSSNYYLSIPNNNGTLALEETTDLQKVLTAGSSALFNSDTRSVILPNESTNYVNINSKNPLSGNNEYFLINGTEGYITQQVGDYNELNPFYGDRTFSINPSNIRLFNNQYSLPADELQNSGNLEVNNNNVKLIAQDVPSTALSTVTVFPNQFHYNVTDSGEEATFYFNHAEGLAFATETTNGYVAKLKSDNLITDVTLQMPVVSGEIALQDQNFYSPNIQLTNVGGNLSLINETTGDLTLKSTGVKLAELGYSGLNLFKSSGTLSGNINVNDLTGSKTYNLPNANGKLVVVGTIAPSSATAPGVVGEIRVTSNYIYTCIATNNWVRATVATW